MLLVTGATGQLGTAFRTLRPRSTFLDRDALDLDDVGSIAPALARHADARAVVNCAAFTAVDEAETRTAAARRINALAVEAMARHAAERGIPFVTFSTDYVFDGRAARPYVESDPTDPVNAYGATKLEGERLALAAWPRTLVVRTSWLLSGTHRNFAATMIRLARRGEVRVVDDQVGCPTVADDLAAATLRALDADASGILHLTNRGETSWYGLARAAVALAGLDPERVQACTSDVFPRPAPRPAYSVLGSERLDALGLEPLPPWRDALPRVVDRLVRLPHVTA